jgi:DNA-directed RNA polymerase specialized sigma24 family protein
LIADLPDLAQETRIALWRIGLDARVTPTLVGHIANNKAVDLVRSVVRRRTRERDSSPSTLSGGDAAEVQHLLNVEVDLLPPRLHDFYELHYRQGFSERDIARKWGLSRSSIQWLDYRCRRALGNKGTH